MHVYRSHKFGAHHRSHGQAINNFLEGMLPTFQLGISHVIFGYISVFYDDDEISWDGNSLW